LLAASALLGIWGDDLALALIGLVRESWSGDLMVGANAGDVVTRIREAIGKIAGPLLGILGGTLAVAIAAHQAQVGGLFAPSVIAPNVSRLWGLKLEEDGMGSVLIERAGRGAWSVVKAVVVVAVAAWLIRSGLGDFQRLSRMDPQSMARAAGTLLKTTALSLAVATLVLGLIDFALQYQRFEAMLRMSPNEHREDLKSADGDPALRARRRNQARALRGDAPELFAGATLAVVGASGLILILAGGPPPRRITIRSSANGATGKRLKKSAEAAKLPMLEAPALALALARLRTPVVAAELMAALSAEWPVEA
jgi:flagellar biosynthetic protein FlhB